MTILREIVTQFVFKGNIRKIESAEQAFDGLRRKIEKADISSEKLDSSFKRLWGSLKKVDNIIRVVAFGALARGFVRFVGNIFSASGMMEQTAVSFETMLGSVVASKKLISEITTFALETPFGIESATLGVKKLLAFGESVDTVIDSLTILGNIQAGTGAVLDRLVLAYGQVKTATILRGQEVRQFTEAGVPLLEELSKLLGVSKKSIQGMISAGEVTSDNVRDALKGMTEEGGIFFDLMKKQTKTLIGRWNKLGDEAFLLKVAIGDMFRTTAMYSVSAMSTLISWTKKALPWIDLLGKGLLALIPILLFVQRTAIIAAIKIGIAWLVAFGPWFLVIGIIASAMLVLGAVIIDIQRHFEGFDSILGPLIDKTMKFLNDIVRIAKFLGVGLFEKIFGKGDILKVAIKEDESMEEYLDRLEKKKTQLSKDFHDISMDRNGTSVIPKSTGSNTSSVINNNSANVGSPNITITIPEGQSPKAMTEIVADGVQYGLQRDLNQSLRTMVR